jgi:hypothetical protein
MTLALAHSQPEAERAPLISGLTLATSALCCAPVYDWRLFCTARASLRDVLARVAREEGLSVDEVCSPSRIARISNARQRFMYEAARDGRWSWLQIARACGRKDHTTAYSGAYAYAKRHGLPAPEARK